MTKLHAAVFDMDGILIDSEPFWLASEIEAMATVGFELTEELYQQTMGLRVNEVVDHWYQRAPWTNRPVEAVADDIVAGVVRRIRESGTPLPGAHEAIEYFRSRGYKIGLATSSFESVIEAVLEACGLQNSFDDTYSAEHEEFGKPHPGVYLRAAERLGSLPSMCIAIEDSVNGIKSAKAAGYLCIGVPDKLAWQHTPERFEIADVLVPTLLDVDDDALKRAGATL